MIAEEETETKGFQESLALSNADRAVLMEIYRHPNGISINSLSVIVKEHLSRNTLTKRIPRYSALGFVTVKPHGKRGQTDTIKPTGVWEKVNERLEKIRSV